MQTRTRKFAISLEMHLEAPTPEEAAERFVERMREERGAFEVEILEDVGEDEWLRLGRRRVEPDR